MARQFDLQARLNLVGPVNIKPIVNSIQSQLKNIKGNINVQLGRGFTTALASSNRGLKDFNRNLAQSIKTANSATQAFNNLSKSLSNIRQASTGINAAIRPLQQANKQIQEVTGSLEDFGAKSALALKRNAAFLLPTTAIFAFVTAAKKGIAEALEFDQELVRLSQVSGKSISNLSGLKKEITSLSTSLGVASKDLVKVSTTLAQAGFTINDTKTVLKGLAESTLAPTFKDIESTTEGVIAAFNQFKLKAGDVEGVLGSLNTVAAAYAVESDDLVTVIRRTGGAFKAAGGNLNELIALFTSVRHTTRESAETIATGFRTIFTRIQRPKTIEYLREFGIELSDLKGKFVGPYEAIRRLSEGLQSLDSKDLRFAGIIEELGGFRQVSKVIPLIQQFATAQEALGIAEAGTGSLARDAATAQQALLVQITRVKEEFADLFRTISSDTGFQAIVHTALSMASAFASLAKSLTPILPILAAIGTAKAFSLLPAFGKGFRSGFANGGLVPGTGNSDSVPANLTPGEFVVKKSAVKRIGAQNLQRFANGGSVVEIAPKHGFAGLFLQPGHDLEVPLHLSPDKLSGKTLQGLLNRKDLRAQGVTKIKDIIGTPDIHFVRGEAPKKFEEGVNSSVLSAIKEQVGTLLPPAAAAQLNTNVDTSSKQLLKNSGIASILGNIFEGALAVIGNHIKPRSPEDFDFEGSTFGDAMKPLFGGIQGITQYFDAKKGGNDRGFQKQAADLLKKAANVAGLKKTEPLRVLKRAGGGNTPGSGTDTVPALLTPGEFVFNKSAAQRIGYGNLHRMNAQGYATGGRVGFSGGRRVMEPETYDLAEGHAAYIKTSYPRSNTISPDSSIARATRQENLFGTGRGSFNSNVSGPGSTSSRISLSELSDSGRKDLFKQTKKLAVDQKAASESWDELVKANHSYTVETNKLTGKQTVRLSALAKDTIATVNQQRASKVSGIITHGGIPEAVQDAVATAGTTGPSRFGRVKSAVGARLRGLKGGNLGDILTTGAALGFASQALPAGKQEIAQSAIGGATAGASAASALAPLLGPLAPIATLAGGVIGGLSGLESALVEKSKKIESVRLDDTIKALQKDLGDLDKSTGLSGKQASALSTLVTASNVTAHNKGVDDLSSRTGFISDKLSSGLFNITGGLVGNTLRNNQLARTATTREEAVRQADSNILSLQAGIGAQVRGGTSVRGIRNTQNFRDLAIEQGKVEFEKRSKVGGKFGEEAAATLQKALFGDKEALEQLAGVGYDTANAFTTSTHKLHELQHQFDGLTKTLNKDVSILQTLGTKFAQASQNLDKLDDAFVSTEDALKGTASALKINGSNSAISLGAPGQEARIKALTGGIGGAVGSNLQSKALEINDVAARLPELLEKFANSGSGTNEPGKEFDANFIADALGHSDIAGAIAANLQKAGREGLDLAKVDPARAADQLIGPIKDSMQHILDDLQKSTVEGANKLTASFQHLATITNDVAAIGDRRAAVGQASRLFGLQTSGQEATFGDLNSAFAAKQGRLLGGVGNNSNSILAALTGGRARERDIEAQIRSNPTLAGSRGEELADLKQSNANLTEALNNLANPTEQLAAINERLATIEQRRNSLSSAAATLNGGTFRDRLALVRNASQAKLFSGFSQAQQRAIAPHLSGQEITNISGGLGILGKNDLATDLQAHSRAGLALNPLFDFANEQRDQAINQKKNILAGAEGATGAQQQLGLGELQRVTQEVTAANLAYAQEVSKATAEANKALAEVAKNGASLVENLAKVPTKVEHTLTAQHTVTFNGLAALQELQPAMRKMVIDQIIAYADKETGQVNIRNTG